ncbi:type II toxin-antitoxin system RelE/ParE family toxin [uncultured Meiothermus sp.]|jgi:plasmid stabilization system protein ParE|uniref:type II toxin-antitoxin system RelE/ParE family toxin n=1 Tax=uncultured Meiothermus sp. TaxID=157471 RepID=UPI002612F8AA|nr:type II toxin-antitoxin system RelE/ParE family toxin [uncultured Meiothermus sp.]
MKVVWSPLATDRAVEIAQFIFQGDSNAAFDWINRLFDATDDLARFPEMGRKEIRELIWRGYRIIYQLKAEEVVVHTLRHGRQPWEELELPVE